VAFRLDEIVPWGRLFEEYEAMFGLTGYHLAGHILGCGDGPAGFNAAASRRGHRVISCDPIYQLSAAEIDRRIRETYPIIMERVRNNPEGFVWKSIRSPEHLGETRMTAMRQFLEDYARGRTDGRYVNAALPALPFPDRAFDLALCSHLLFTYSDNLSFDFHLAALLEMCRLAEEVRVFPTLNIDGSPSIHLEPAVSALRKRGYRVELVPVDYEFQRGANRTLCIQTNQ